MRILLDIASSFRASGKQSSTSPLLGGRIGSGPLAGVMSSCALSSIGELLTSGEGERKYWLNRLSSHVDELSRVLSLLWRGEVPSDGVRSTLDWTQKFISSASFDSVRSAEAGSDNTSSSMTDEGMLLDCERSEGTIVDDARRLFFAGTGDEKSSGSIQYSAPPSPADFLFNLGFYAGSAEDREGLARYLDRVRLKVCTSTKRCCKSLSLHKTVPQRRCERARGQVCPSSCESTWFQSAWSRCHD